MNVPIQSLIDHINTALDVDPWAKEMAEQLLTARIPKRPATDSDGRGFLCGSCGRRIGKSARFCQACGREVARDG